MRSIRPRPRAVSTIGTRSIELRQQPIDRREPGCAFHLRQDDAVETKSNDRQQVAIAELGVDGVDANIEKPLAWARHRRDDRIARGPLLGRGHRVFEIEDDRVGIEGQRLLDPPGVVSRRKQKAA
jgi:hypothetical protein